MLYYPSKAAKFTAQLARMSIRRPASLAAYNFRELKSSRPFPLDDYEETETPL